MPEYTADEARTIALLGEAATLFAQLPRQHPDEVYEFNFFIHGAQAIVMGRFAQRHESSGLTPVKEAPRG